jgi:hypothetical protein
MTWTSISTFSHVGAYGQQGRAGYCAGSMKRLPSRILLRSAAPGRHRPLVLETFLRGGEDGDLSLSYSDLLKLGVANTAVEAAPMEMKRARFYHRYWYSRNFKLAFTAALLSWLASITVGIFTYSKFRADQSGSSLGPDKALAILATVVLISTALSATTKFVFDVKQSRQ